MGGEKYFLFIVFFNMTALQTSKESCTDFFNQTIFEKTSLYPEIQDAFYKTIKKCKKKKGEPQSAKEILKRNKAIIKQTIPPGDEKMRLITINHTLEIDYLEKKHRNEMENIIENYENRVTINALLFVLVGSILLVRTIVPK